LSAALPVSLLDPVPAFGVAEVPPVVAPVLLVLREPLLRLSLFGLLVPVPDAPMLLLPVPDAPPVDVLLGDWQPAASMAASVTAINAAGRIDGLMSM
jgi:hypothetical protein